MTEEEKDELISRRQALKSLLESPGWEELTKIVEAQVDNREKSLIVKDLHDPAQLQEARRLSEERKALKLLLLLPATHIETLTFEIEGGFYDELEHA